MTFTSPLKQHKQDLSTGGQQVHLRIMNFQKLFQVLQSQHVLFKILPLGGSWCSKGERSISLIRLAHGPMADCHQH